jgi:hypothetical protein
VLWRDRQPEKRRLDDDVRYTVRSWRGLIENLHGPRQTLLGSLATPAKKNYKAFRSGVIQSSPRSADRKKRPLIRGVLLFLAL